MFKLKCKKKSTLDWIYYCVIWTLNLSSNKNLKFFALKVQVMQIKKALINDRLRVLNVKLPPFNYLYFSSDLPVKFAILWKSILFFNIFYCLFCL